MSLMQQRTILLVDDEQDLVNMLKLNLERQGFKVLTALNGQEALDLLRQSDVDLIITDVIMPVLDGFGLYKKIKNQFSTARIPVIVFSARHAMEDSFRALGAEEFLSKPCDHERLVNRIRKVLGFEERTLRKKRVLISGSNPATLKDMYVHIEDHQWEPVVAKHTADLFALSFARKPDVILLDIMGRDIPSKQFVRAFRCLSDLSTIPIILYTDLPFEELNKIDVIEKIKDIKTACLTAGANGYMGRYSPEVLKEQLEGSFNLSP